MIGTGYDVDSYLGGKDTASQDVICFERLD